MFYLIIILLFICIFVVSWLIEYKERKNNSVKGKSYKITTTDRNNIKKLLNIYDSNSEAMNTVYSQLVFYDNNNVGIERLKLIPVDNFLSHEEKYIQLSLWDELQNSTGRYVAYKKKGINYIRIENDNIIFEVLEDSKYLICNNYRMERVF